LPAAIRSFGRWILREVVNDARTSASNRVDFALGLPAQRKCDWIFDKQAAAQA
jgi:hypothetical protein